MQDRFHMYENLTLDFYKKKCNVSLDFWPAVPLAVEIHLLVCTEMCLIQGRKIKAYNKPSQSAWSAGEQK